jgi:hypothetical protein
MYLGSYASESIAAHAHQLRRVEIGDGARLSRCEFRFVA